MAYKSSPRGSRAVSLVTVHTAEGSRTAASLGAYFFRSDIQASSHVGIDGGNTLQYVGYDRAAWTLRSGNPISDNAELCGFARWTRDQWMSTGVVDGVTNPRAILDRTAAWIRSRCLARGIPIRKIGAADVAAGRSGVIGHWDWTVGAKDGTHTDPGSNFPWDYVISRAAGGDPAPAKPAPAPIPEPAQEVEIMERITVTPPNADQNTVRVFLSGSPGAAVVIRPRLAGDGFAKAMWVGDIFAWGSDHQGIGHNPTQTAGYVTKLTSHRRYALPGAVWADINYSAAEPFEIDIVG